MSLYSAECRIFESGLTSLLDIMQSSVQMVVRPKMTTVKPLHKSNCSLFECVSLNFFKTWAFTLVYLNTFKIQPILEGIHIDVNFD